MNKLYLAPLLLTIACGIAYHMSAARERMLYKNFYIHETQTRPTEKTRKKIRKIGNIIENIELANDTLFPSIPIDSNIASGDIKLYGDQSFHVEVHPMYDAERGGMRKKDGRTVSIDTLVFHDNNQEMEPFVVKVQRKWEVAENKNGITTLKPSHRTLPSSFPGPFSESCIHIFEANTKDAITNDNYLGYIEVERGRPDIYITTLSETKAHHETSTAPENSSSADTTTPDTRVITRKRSQSTGHCNSSGPATSNKFHAEKTEKQKHTTHNPDTPKNRALQKNHTAVTQHPAVKTGKNVIQTVATFVNGNKVHAASKNTQKTPSNSLTEQAFPLTCTVYRTRNRCDVACAEIHASNLHRPILIALPNGHTFSCFSPRKSNDNNHYAYLGSLDWKPGTIKCRKEVTRIKINNKKELLNMMPALSHYSNLCTTNTGEPEEHHNLHNHQESNPDNTNNTVFAASLPSVLSPIQATKNNGENHENTATDSTRKTTSTQSLPKQKHHQQNTQNETRLILPNFQANALSPTTSISKTGHPYKPICLPRCASSATQNNDDDHKNTAIDSLGNTTSKTLQKFFTNPYVLSTAGYCLVHYYAGHTLKNKLSAFGVTLPQSKAGRITTFATGAALTNLGVWSTKKCLTTLKNMVN